MKSQRIIAGLGPSLLLSALLALGAGTAFASPPQQDHQRQGLFGNVVQVDGDSLIVITDDGETVHVRLSTETKFVKPGRKGGEDTAVQLGDRVAISISKKDEGLTARKVMVVPRKVTVAHVVGVVADIDDGGLKIITDSGREVRVRLTLNQNVPGPGTVVTVVGHEDPSTGEVEARSFHELGDTLERLSRHLDEIEQDIPDEHAQVKHLTRLRHLLEKNSQRQLEILSKVIDRLPEQAWPALEQAVRQLDEANQHVLRAFSKALGKVDTAAAPGKDSQRKPGDADEVKPTLQDVAGVLGLSADEVEQLFREGITLAQIAQKAGITEDALIEGVLARVHQRLERLVSAGRLDPEDVDRVIQELREEIKLQFHRAPDKETDGGEREFHPGIYFSLEDLAKVLGIDPADLLAASQQGKSLLLIAEERGLTRAQFIDALMSLATERAQSLQDRGQLTADEARRFLEKFRLETLRSLTEGASSELKRGDTQGFPITPEDVANALGLPIKEVFSHFEGGGTLQQLARRQGVSTDSLIEQLVELGRQRLASIVEEGRISPEEMEQRLLQLKESMFEELARTPGRLTTSSRPATVVTQNVPFNLGTLARALDLSSDELRRLLAEGYSVEEIASERNASLEHLAEALLETVEERLHPLVEEERISEEQARLMLDRMRQGTLQQLRVFRLPEQGNLRPGAGDRGVPSGQPGSQLPVSFAEIARVLGVDLEELMQRARSEGSLLPLLKERGIEPQDLAEKLVALFEDRLGSSPPDGDAVVPDNPGRILDDLMYRLQEAIAGRGEDSFGPGREPVQPPPRLTDGALQKPIPSILPSLTGAADIFRALGVAEKATDLQRRGLTVAETARELHYDTSSIFSTLLEIAERRVAAAVQSSSLSREQSKELLATFERLARQQVATLFADMSTRDAGSREPGTIEEPNIIDGTQPESDGSVSLLKKDGEPFSEDDTTEKERVTAA